MVRPNLPARARKGVATICPGLELFDDRDSDPVVVMGLKAYDETRATNEQVLNLSWMG